MFTPNRDALEPDLNDDFAVKLLQESRTHG
jgi:hypothetical protein